MEINGEGDSARFTRADLVARVALDAVDVSAGHLAIDFVDARAIARLNAEHRGRDGPTDVLSFPIDQTSAAYGPRELGDIVICPEQTEDLDEAVVHGVLHLCGYDHETDDGEMLELQDRVM
ncbi:MAG: rRNA maturation RNase YbeY, partial [Solirubrobacterales bacterium]